jgi:hypothetical protein
MFDVISSLLKEIQPVGIEDVSENIHVNYSQGSVSCSFSNVHQ